MTMKELREKSLPDLHKLLAETRDSLREKRFRVHERELKNVRDVRVTRKLIAKILTVMHEKR
ncbi:MAG: 50S ribosomal protein L29 [Candidatus Kerfeldbacteria bacterium]|nr:50S ribosomal protein L29 [Candidatus Kerfeldbacteria bacterium]